jgi:nucleotide-binding universal stress UspA family protein
MFKKIAVACNETPEANRALASAIQLAKTLGAELRVVILKQELPAFTAFASAADSSLTQALLEDRSQHYGQLQVGALKTAWREGVVSATHLLDGEGVEALLDFLAKEKPDLLVIGLHRHTSHISRLWNIVFELAQDAPCSVLGVH